MNARRTGIRPSLISRDARAGLRRVRLDDAGQDVRAAALVRPFRVPGIGGLLERDLVHVSTAPVDVGGLAHLPLARSEEGVLLAGSGRPGRRDRCASPARGPPVRSVAGVVPRVPRAGALRDALHEPHGAPGEHPGLTGEAVDPQLRERGPALSPALALAGLVVRRPKGRRRRRPAAPSGPKRTGSPLDGMSIMDPSLGGRACKHGPAEHDDVGRRLDGVVGDHLDGTATVQPAPGRRHVA